MAVANVLYDLYKQACLDGSAPDLTSVDVKQALVDTDTYSFSQSHEFLSDVSGITASSGNLTGKSVTDGVFDSDGSVFSEVSGDESEALILYVDTGSAATSRLIAYVDTAGGLPITPNGEDITLNAPAGGWFAL